MDWSRAFGPPAPLKCVLETMDALPDQWLYIPLGVEQIEADTPCRACIVENKELSPEEQDELDEYPETVGLMSFAARGHRRQSAGTASIVLGTRPHGRDQVLLEQRCIH